MVSMCVCVPHQTWLCSFACHRDRAPSCRCRRTGRRTRRTVRHKVEQKKSEMSDTSEKIRKKKNTSLSAPADGNLTSLAWFYSPSPFTPCCSASVWQLLTILDAGPRQEVEFIWSEVPAVRRRVGRRVWNQPGKKKLFRSQATAKVCPSHFNGVAQLAPCWKIPPFWNPGGRHMRQCTEHVQWCRCPLWFCNPQSGSNTRMRQSIRTSLIKKL